MEKDNQQPQFLDAEDLSFYKQGQEFSHQVLVMQAMQRALEAGSHEMRPGWFNEKIDDNGNVVRTYVEDTRSKFVECVKSVEMAMFCDFDEEASDHIRKLKKKLKQRKDNLLHQQWTWHNSLRGTIKQNALKQYGEVFKPSFNSRLPWWQVFVEHELEAYRLIFKELTKLSKRLGFYESKKLTQ